MRKYWFILNDTRLGPYTLEGSRTLPLQPDTPVWYDGLPDWTLVGELQEASMLLDGVSTPPPVDEIVPPEIPATPPPMPSEPKDDVEAIENDEAEILVTDEAESSEIVEETCEAFTPPTIPVEPMEPCPSSFLVWNIVTTLLCCMPIGVIGIIFSSKVSSAWRAGDMARARRYSERAEWCVILSISLGLLLAPLQWAMQALMAL